MAGLQPALLGDLGFQLSALATLGLVLVMPALQPRLAALPVTARGPAEALAATLAAIVAVQPLLTATFGQVSLIAPLANLLAAPWVPLVMIGGVTVAALGLLAGPVTGEPFVPVLSDLAGWATTLVATPMLAVVETGAALPLATITLPPPPPAVTLALYATLGVLALPLLTPAPAATARRALGAARRAWPALGLVALTVTAGAMWMALVH
jgi:competence protein ComEC